MKNKLISGLLFSAVLGLTACGGDSDSSGSTTATPSNPTTPTNPIPPTSVTCPSTGINPVKVTVKNNSSCTFSIPNLNKGTAETYKCTNGTLSTPLGTSGGTTTFGGYEISCAK